MSKLGFQPRLCCPNLANLGDSLASFLKQGIRVTSPIMYTISWLLCRASWVILVQRVILEKKKKVNCFILGQVFLLRQVALSLWKWDNRLGKTSGVSTGSGWDLTRVKSQVPLTPWKRLLILKGRELHYCQLWRTQLEPRGWLFCISEYQLLYLSALLPRAVYLASPSPSFSTLKWKL